MAFVVNNVTLPWIIVSLALGAFIMILMLLFIMIFKMTHAGVELKAKMKGRPISIFFDDNRSITFKASEVSAGLVVDDKFGTYIQNEKGSYIDRDKKIVYLPFSTTIAMGASAKLFKASDALYKVLGDEKALAEIREGLANGTITTAELGEFESLKESIDFSQFKSLMNAILPHNLSAKISMEVAKRLNSYGKENTSQMMWFVIIGLGLIGLIALLLIMFRPQAATTIIQQAPQLMQNATGMMSG